MWTEEAIDERRVHKPSIQWRVPFAIVAKNFHAILLIVSEFKQRISKL